MMHTFAARAPQRGIKRIDIKSCSISCYVCNLKFMIHFMNIPTCVFTIKIELSTRNFNIQCGK